jgi:hypothetical protein
MKRLSVILILFLITTSVFAQPAPPPTEPITIRNRGTCDLDYTFRCTSNDCTTIYDEDSGTLTPGGSISLSCPSGDFAVLKFIYVDGDNVTRYITFDEGLTNDCAGIEECSDLYPTQWQGVEVDCLGVNGEIRANLISGSCQIVFKQ